MLQSLLATKIGMGQTWTKSGYRIPVTKLRIEEVLVVGLKNQEKDGYSAVQIGFGKMKLENMTKPLRSIISKSGFSFGVRKIKEVKKNDDVELNVGDTVLADQVLAVGDVVNIQGTTKGKGFSGVMKRHGFSGGPRTHGQSDRSRAPGAIGNRTTPGRVFKGKRMAGQYGNTTATVKNLEVVYLNMQSNELWVSGPVPGSMSSTLVVKKVGHHQPKEIVFPVAVATEQSTQKDAEA